MTVYRAPAQISLLRVLLVGLKAALGGRASPGGRVVEMVLVTAFLISLTVLSGCAASIEGASDSLDRIEAGKHEINTRLTRRALSWMCNEVSMRAWREQFDRSPRLRSGWMELCSSRPPPLLLPPIDGDRFQ